jgi:hypothetical protein
LNNRNIIDKKTKKTKTSLIKKYKHHKRIKKIVILKEMLSGEVQLEGLWCTGFVVVTKETNNLKIRANDSSR